MGNDAEQSMVPGQTVLPGMADDLGYEAITLKPAQERYCWEYVLRNDNQCRAYMISHDEQDSAKARKNASKLMQKSDILRRIDEVRAELKRKYTATADDIIQYHTKVLKIDRGEYLDEHGKPRRLEDIDAEASSILEFDCERDSKFGTIHVMMQVPQRHQSAVELAKILGLHKENFDVNAKHEHTGAVGVTNDAAKLDQLRSRFKGMAYGAVDTPP